MHFGSENCSFHQSNGEDSTDMPCLIFWHETRDSHLERTAHIFADIVFPLLSETIIKGILLSLSIICLMRCMKILLICIIIIIILNRAHSNCSSTWKVSKIEAMV